MKKGAAESRKLGRVKKGLFWELALVFVICSAVVGVVPAAASDPNDRWADNFSIPGVNGTVYAMAKDANGNLYVGGSFTHAGGAPANNIAMWDGTKWHAVGSGLVTTWALAVGQDGKLYAGQGEYLSIWDGSAWTHIGCGHWVFALAVDGNAVYVGGYFGCAKWDGSTLHSLGELQGGPVAALAVDSNGNLYAGGEFLTANPESVTVNGIAMWDGSAWSPLGTGMNNYVYALACVGSSLYVGGAFTTAGGVPVNYLAKWDGITSTWSDVVCGLNFSGGGGEISLRGRPRQSLCRGPLC